MGFAIAMLDYGAAGERGVLLLWGLAITLAERAVQASEIERVVRGCTKYLGICDVNRWEIEGISDV